MGKLLAAAEGNNVTKETCRALFFFVDSTCALWSERRTQAKGETHIICGFSSRQPCQALSRIYTCRHGALGANGLRLLRFHSRKPRPVAEYLNLILPFDRMSWVMTGVTFVALVKQCQQIWKKY